MATIASFAALLLGSGITLSAVIVVILTNPEKVEKWSGLLWKAIDNLRLGFRFAHKKYIQHDFQGSVNDFVKHHAKEMPGFQVKGVRLDWVDADVKRQAFIEADQVVVRVRREDPHHENFVKAVYLFISTALLYRAKRYISPPQGRAIDLFVTAELFKEQKPEVVDHFLEEYLHPHIDEGSGKVGAYFEQFALIAKAGLFFPVFLQEMDYLGLKVFGSRKSQEIVKEVAELIDFLENLAVRRVGDENTDLNFVRQYCRFAVVIIGKPAKVTQSVAPYIKFIRDGLDRNIETVYLIGRLENEERIQQVCGDLSDLYALVCSKHVSKVILYGEEKRKIEGFVAVLRSKSRTIYASASTSAL